MHRYPSRGGNGSFFAWASVSGAAFASLLTVLFSRGRVSVISVRFSHELRAGTAKPAVAHFKIRKISNLMKKMSRRFFLLEPFRPFGVSGNVGNFGLFL